MTDLEEFWKCATSSIGAPSGISDKWYTKLIQAYSNETRNYHNVNNLEHKLNNYEKIKCNLKNRNAVTLALFFHYFEYDPKLVDCCSKNIDHFHEFAKESGLAMDSDICKDVIKLLEAADTQSTEEHKVDGLYGSEDHHYFLDLDMVVLGSEPEEYADYITKVEQEYSFLSPLMYKSLRSKVLQNFLQIPNIFATKEFRELYEKQARVNIQTEVEKLK